MLTALCQIPVLAYCGDYSEEYYTLPASLAISQADWSKEFHGVDGCGVVYDLNANQYSLVPINDLIAVNNVPLRERDFIEWMDEIMSARIKVPFVIVVSLSAFFYAIVLASIILKMKVVACFLIFHRGFY